MTETGFALQIDEAKISAYLEKFIATLGVCQRYAPDSQLVFDSVKSLYALLRNIISDSDALNLSEFHNNLIINNSALSVNFQSTPLVGAFVFFMLENNLRAISFQKDVTQADLKSLLDTLSDNPEKIRANPVESLRALNVEGISVEPLGEKERESAREIVLATMEPETTSMLMHPDELPSQIESDDSFPGNLDDSDPMQSLPHARQRPPRQNESEVSYDEDPDPFSLPETLSSPQKSISEEGETRILVRPNIDLDSTGEQTQIMSRPTKADSYQTAMRKKIMQEDVRPPGTVLLVVMTKLGRQIVDDAKVIILTDPEVERVTARQRGASFFLLPGNYKIRVIYDKYIMVYDIQIGADLDEIQMDVNLLDAAT
jgi:hypothetical protein